MPQDADCGRQCDSSRGCSCRAGLRADGRACLCHMWREELSFEKAVSVVQHREGPVSCRTTDAASSVSTCTHVSKFSTRTRSGTRWLHLLLRRCERAYVAPGLMRARCTRSTVRCVVHEPCRRCAQASVCSLRWPAQPCRSLACIPQALLFVIRGGKMMTLRGIQQVECSLPAARMAVHASDAICACIRAVPDPALRTTSMVAAAQLSMHLWLVCRTQWRLK